MSYTSLYRDTPIPSFPRNAHNTAVEDLTIASSSQSYGIFSVGTLSSVFESETTVYPSSVFSGSSQNITIGW